MRAVPDRSVFSRRDNGARASLSFDGAPRAGREARQEEDGR